MHLKVDISLRNSLLTRRMTSVVELGAEKGTNGVVAAPGAPISLLENETRALASKFQIRSTQFEIFGILVDKNFGQFPSPAPPLNRISPRQVEVGFFKCTQG